MRYCPCQTKYERQMKPRESSGREQRGEGRWGGGSPKSLCTHQRLQLYLLSFTLSVNKVPLWLLCRGCRQLRARQHELVVARQHSFQVSHLYLRAELRGWSNGWAGKSTRGSKSRTCIVAQNSSSGNPTTSSCTDVVYTLRHIHINKC